MRSMPFDMKNYRANHSGLALLAPLIAIILLTAALGWMGERDRQAHVQRVQAAASQCK